MAFVEQRRGVESAHAARRPAYAKAADSTFGRGRSNSNSRARQPHATCPELDFLRHRLPPPIIAFAEQRAAQAGVGADRILIDNSAISEDAYALALASSLGATFNPLEGLSRAHCALSDDRLLEGVTSGILPFNIGGRRVFLVTLRGLVARKMTTLLRPKPQLGKNFHITTDQHLRRFVMRTAPGVLRRKAAEELKNIWPAMSASSRISRLPLLLALAAASVILTAAPATTMAAVELAATLVFLAWAGLRLLGTFTRGIEHPTPRRLSDDKLPIYSIIVALYREAACVPDLVRALNALDYPREKLDVKFVLEADDFETLFAFQRLGLGLGYEIIISPAGGPRTKPKALNAALPFARGSFVVVYDAEDRPDPDQGTRGLSALG